MANTQSSYQAKLLDPRWQRKRLEALQKADFHCESCGDGENTLHVHHKQYIKGREPWEYEADQLCVLCKDCHAESHEKEDALTVISSFAAFDGPKSRGVCASLLAGYIGLSMKLPQVCDPDAYIFGALAAALGWNSGVDLSRLSDWTEFGPKDTKALAKIFLEAEKKGGFCG